MLVRVVNMTVPTVARTINTTIEKVVEWYKAEINGQDCLEMTYSQIEDYGLKTLTS